MSSDQLPLIEISHGDPSQTVACDGLCNWIDAVLQGCSNGQKDALDEEGLAALHYAAKFNRVHITRKLLDANCDPNVCTKDDLTPLHYAVWYCPRTFMELTGTTDALSTTNLEVMQMLLQAICGGEGRPLPVKYKQGTTPLHMACARGNVHAVQELLKYIEDVDLRDNQERLPLHYAARKDQVAVIDFLISRECDKDARDNEYMSPLLLAAKCGRAKAVKALISGGCELNLKDRYDRSAVYWAAQEGHMDVLEALLEHQKGIQLCFETERCHQNTPLHAAASLGKTHVVELLVTDLPKQLCNVVAERPQALQDEREKLENLDLCRNVEKKTPLHLAAENGKMDVVRLLVRKHPPAITDEDVNGNTPLHLAALHGRTGVVDFLISEEANVNERNSCGYTPLDLAADKSHAEVIPVLIKAGANVEKVDKFGRTPLFRACEYNNLETAKVLLKNNAKVIVHNEKLNGLDVAVEGGHKNVALAIIQSEQWKTALRYSNGLMTPFRRMIVQMPSVAKEVLDRCMSETTDANQLEMNYEFLEDYHTSDDSDKNAGNGSEKSEEFVAEWRPKGFSRKYHPLALMVSYMHADLLRHPVVQSLLEYKLSRYGTPLFCLNLITYGIFLIFLTIYALLLPHPDQAFSISLFLSITIISSGLIISLMSVLLMCHDFSVTQLVSSLPVNGTVCPFESGFANDSEVFIFDPTVPFNNHANVALYFAAVMVIITAVARLLVVEFYQLVRKHCRYFLKFENWIEVLAYFLSIPFVSHFGSNCWCSTSWQWQLGSIAVFLAWINFILFLKRLPLLGIYVLMFKNILSSFLKFALIAFLFVVAFCIAFYMILYKAPNDTTLPDNVSPFRNVFLSFVKTTVMTIGEFEYDSLFGHNCECTGLLTSFPTLGYVFWIIFLIVMPTLLSNLLVALAVDDTKAIQKQACLKRDSVQINAILDTEQLLPEFILCHLVKRQRFVNQKQSKRWCKRFRDCFSCKEHCNSAETSKKHTQLEESPFVEQVQDQAVLFRDLQKMQTEMMELMKRNDSILEQNSRIMEKNNRMEQLLATLVQKQRTCLPPEDADMQTESEA